jgi:DNA adenine methylase
MPATMTPLRYPGGKTQFYPLVKNLLEKNGLTGHTYIEPFAGGSGIAIKLLLNNDVNHIIINDIDPAIYAFWYSVLHFSEDLCNLINKTPVDVAQWKKQKQIYLDKKSNVINLGFATLFLNRANVSGIINGGIIGGLQQNGPYGIDARFTKKNLIKKIEAIHTQKNKIDIYNLDAIELLKRDEIKKLRKTLVNFDPPYVTKGAGLYENSFLDADHKRLASIIKKCSRRWIVTYDVHPLITELYFGFRFNYLDINYSVNRRRKEKEYIFFSDNLDIPETIKYSVLKQKRGELP